MIARLVDQDLNQPASVVWIDDLPPPGRLMSGTALKLTSLRDAIRYVMEVIDPEYSDSAMVTCDAGTWQLDEISAAYMQMRSEDEIAPRVPEQKKRKRKASLSKQLSAETRAKISEKMRELNRRTGKLTAQANQQVARLRKPT